MTAVKTTCPYCGVGCGVIAERGADGAVGVSGDRAHPANFGRLCSKGSALAETIDLEGRLLTPRIDGADANWTRRLGPSRAASRRLSLNTAPIRSPSMSPANC